MKQLINREKFSSVLRRKGIDVSQRKILTTKFGNSKQKGDFSVPPNCNGWGRIHHFDRWSGGGEWPENSLPIDPAHNALGLPKVDKVQVQVFQNAI